VAGADAGYLGEPDAGPDAVRDAVAAIRCVAGGDPEGLHAVLNGTDSPRQVAAVLASITAVIFLQGGLDAAGIASVLGEMTAQANDFPLGVVPGPSAEGGDPHRRRV
jgi:hypothetical protein